MSALSESLQFVVYTTATVEIMYPNTATGVMVYTSERIKGDGYYGGSDGFHTVSYTAAQTFIGTMTMQASLATEPAESDWFFIPETEQNYTVLDARSTSTVDCYNFEGNFVWLRGYVAIADGAVEAIQVNH